MHRKNFELPNEDWAAVMAYMASFKNTKDARASQISEGKVEFALIRLYEFRLLCDSFSLRSGQVPRLKIDPCLLATYFHLCNVRSGCRMLVDALSDRPKCFCLLILFFPDFIASGCTFGDN